MSLKQRAIHIVLRDLLKVENPHRIPGTASAQIDAAEALLVRGDADDCTVARDYLESGLAGDRGFDLTQRVRAAILLLDMMPSDEVAE